MNPSLPPPEPAALVHSERLARYIRETLQEKHGWLSFADYMRLALYAPGLGYYTAGSRKFGPAGDFTTAPEMCPLFASALARQAAEVLQATGGDLLELGPGSGRLAAQLLRALEQRGALPQRYLLLEPSPDLQQRQRSLLEAEVPGLAARCRWISVLPERFQGLMLGNEVLDALPAECIRHDDEGFWQRGVAWDEAGAFQWQDRALTTGALADAARERCGDFFGSTEINLAAEALVRTLVASLDQGLLLFIDYGFPAREYYHPQRETGTLNCHYRHRAHGDPFFLPGLQDITVHVDFTAIAVAASEAGAELAGYASQAQFLLNCGILDLLAEDVPEAGPHRLRALQAVNQFTHPAEMGELFKAIAFTRGIALSLCGFTAGDRSYRL